MELDFPKFLPNVNFVEETVYTMKFNTTPVWQSQINEYFNAKSMMFSRYKLFQGQMALPKNETFIYA